jgi:hypothetical protein
MRKMFLARHPDMDENCFGIMAENREEAFMILRNFADNNRDWNIRPLVHTDEYIFEFLHVIE